MKNAIKKLINLSGYEIKKINPFPLSEAPRPVGDMEKFLEDLKLRGLNCKAIMDVGANRTGWEPHG